MRQLRLMDANVFIEAKNRYYGFDLVPAFWQWLEDQATAGTIASTDLVYKELLDGKDELAEWAKDHKEALFRVSSNSKQVALHVDALVLWSRKEGYSEAAIDDFLARADPFLIGAAAETGSVVVTMEVPAGNSRKKVKIPDACDHLNVPHEDTFQMMRNLRARFA